MKKFYTKENEEVAKQIREALLADGQVEVHNEYETFYGVGFDGWLKKKLEDLNVEYKVTSYNRWEGYPWTYVITLLEGEKKEKKILKKKVLRVRARVNDYKTAEYVQSMVDFDLTDEQVEIVAEILNKAGLGCFKGFGSVGQEDLTYMSTPLVQQVKGNSGKKVNRFGIDPQVYITEIEYTED